MRAYIRQKTFARTWLASLKVVRMPLPRLERALEDVRIKNAAVAPTIVVDRRPERSPS